MNELLAGLLVGFTGTIVVILLAAIPWAYYAGRDLSDIKGQLKAGSHRMAGHEKSIENHGVVLECHAESINDHETRITVIEKMHS